MSLETPLTIDCNGDRLVGILHPGVDAAGVGVVITVGGPQYRVGSHRQFVLMARQIAAAGIPVLRFDYRGMGDSEGDARTFESVNDDIQSAVTEFCRTLPSLRKVILLGLCDAASANLMFSATDDRVCGLVLLNPWVRTQQGEAKSYLKHYYLQRFLQKSFWRKVFSGEMAVTRSVSEFLASIRNLRGSEIDASTVDTELQQSFIAEMLSGLQRFRHPILVMISGRDLTAQEFIDLCKSNSSWRKCLKRPEVTTQHFPDADHTMSAREHLRAATLVSINWIFDNVGR